MLDLIKDRPNDGPILCSQLDMSKSYQYYNKQATIVAKEDVKVEYLPQKASIVTRDDLVPKKYYKLIFIDQRTNIVYDVILKEDKDHYYMINTNCLEDH